MSLFVPVRQLDHVPIISGQHSGQQPGACDIMARHWLGIWQRTVRRWEKKPNGCDLNGATGPNTTCTLNRYYMILLEYRIKMVNRCNSRLQQPLADLLFACPLILAISGGYAFHKMVFLVSYAEGVSHHRLEVPGQQGCYKFWVWNTKSLKIEVVIYPLVNWEGKSQSFIGKSTINGQFSIAMLNYQRVL